MNEPTWKSTTTFAPPPLNLDVFINILVYRGCRIQSEIVEGQGAMVTIYGPTGTRLSRDATTTGAVRLLLDGALIRFIQDEQP